MVPKAWRKAALNAMLAFGVVAAALLPTTRVLAAPAPTPDVYLDDQGPRPADRVSVGYRNVSTDTAVGVYKDTTTTAYSLSGYDEGTDATKVVSWTEPQQRTGSYWKFVPTPRTEYRWTPVTVAKTGWHLVEVWGGYWSDWWEEQMPPCYTVWVHHLDWIATCGQQWESYTYYVTDCEYLPYTVYDCVNTQFFFTYWVDECESRTDHYKIHHRHWVACAPTTASCLVSSRSKLTATAGNADDRAKNALFNSDSRDGAKADYSGSKKRDALGVTAIDEGNGKGKGKGRGD